MVEFEAVLDFSGPLAGANKNSSGAERQRSRPKRQFAQLAVSISSRTQPASRRDEGADALIEPPSDVQNFQPGGYLDTTDVPTDGWGNEFIYELYPESGKPFVIKSLGADSQDGGEGYNADLLSTDR